MKKSAKWFVQLFSLFVMVSLLAGCATVPRLDKSLTSFRELRETSLGDVGVMWKDAEALLMDVPLNRELTKTILPFGLCPTDPAMGTLVVVNYPIFPYGKPYREAILMIHVQTLLGEGWHCAWILVDDDVALIPGRELLGYPKKMGTFTFSGGKSGIQATVQRRGVKLISVKAKRGEKEEEPAPVFARKTFNVGGLGQMYVLSPLLLFNIEEKIKESYKATAHLKMKRSIYDPIAEIISGPPVNARIVKFDILDNDYYFMLWMTGGRGWFLNTFNMRYR